MVFRRIALLLVVVALVGCNNEKNRNLIDRHADETIRMGQQALVPAPKKSFDPLTVSDKIWSGNASTRLRRGLPLPARFETSRGVTLISGQDMTLADIALAIGEQTGVTVRLMDDASGSSSKRRKDDEGDSSEGMGVAYEGSLSGLLDLVASKFGVTWRYDGASIKFSKYETRVFVIESLPGTQSVKDGIKDDSSGGGGGSSGGSVSSLSQSAEMNIEFKLWDDLRETLDSMLGGVGTVVLSPSSGTATITTTPDLMGVVAKYIEEENQRLARQIAINIEIYTVSLTDDTDFSVTFDTALKKLTSLGGNYTSAGSPVEMTKSASLGSLSVAILNPNSTGQITSVFSALSSVGDTTRVAQFPLTTLNNRAVSRRIGRQRAYVKSISNTSSGSDYSSSSVETDTIQEGFSLQLTPRLLEDGRIMMQYSLSLNDIIEMATFDTGAGSVQLPEMSTRTFVQQAMLKSGSTLIIGGYDDEQIAQTSQGVGSAYNYFLGGGSVNAKSRSMMFIAVTPQVLDVPKAERN